MNPRVVTAVIVEYDGRVLLQQRAIEPRRGYWTFPGGFLEFGEMPEDGARRETKEEVGLDVTIEALHGVYARPDVGIVLVVYRGTSDSDAAIVGDFESMAVRLVLTRRDPVGRAGVRDDGAGAPRLDRLASDGRIGGGPAGGSAEGVPDQSPATHGV